MSARDVLLASSVRPLLAGGAALAALAAVALAREDAPPAGAPVLAMEAREPAVAVREVALEDEVEEPEAADLLDSIDPMGEIEDPADFTFVVEVGGKTYVRIARAEDVAVDAERHRAELVRDDWVTSAIAPLSADALPEPLRPWRGRRVLVDGTCAATVVGFAEIGRVSGDPRYTSLDEDVAGTTWTVETAFAAGRTMIAGELAGDCTGSWARAADRPAVGHAIAADDPRLERAARDAFLASPHADAIAADWREAAQEGDWRDHVPLDAFIVRHSITGARWAYVHARRPGGCGEHRVDVAVTYQVSEDGALTEIGAGDLPGDVLGSLVDLNGDGWLERLVIHSDPADLTLVGPIDETELAAIDVPFHGCGC